MRAARAARAACGAGHAVEDLFGRPHIVGKIAVDVQETRTQLVAPAGPSSTRLLPRPSFAHRRPLLLELGCAGGAGGAGVVRRWAKLAQWALVRQRAQRRSGRQRRSLVDRGVIIVDRVVILIHRGVILIHRGVIRGREGSLASLRVPPVGHVPAVPEPVRRPTYERDDGEADQVRDRRRRRHTRGTCRHAWRGVNDLEC